MKKKIEKIILQIFSFLLNDHIYICVCVCEWFFLVHASLKSTDEDCYIYSVSLSKYEIFLRESVWSNCPKEGSLYTETIDERTGVSVSVK